MYRPKACLWKNLVMLRPVSLIQQVSMCPWQHVADTTKQIRTVNQGYFEHFFHSKLNSGSNIEDIAPIFWKYGGKRERCTGLHH